MNENELKSIERYYKKFNEDPSLFNEFEANDFIKLLKNNNRNDDAIEVGKTFLTMVPELKNYINQYGYALYNKFIHIDDEKIKEKENLFFDILDEIVSLCKQEKYSPVEPAINRAVKYALNQKPINYELIIRMLDKLDFKLLSDKPFVTADGREFESFKERYFRLKVRALYETKNYRSCVECANNALAVNLKWHYNALQWIKYYRGCSLVELEEYDEANREFVSLHNRIKGVNFYEVLYRTHVKINQIKEANAYLLYDFFESGYDISLLNMYLRIKEATDQTQNSLLMNIVDSFIKKLCDEHHKPCQLEVAEKYQNKNSSELYDDMYDLIMSHLNQYVERKSGKIVYYNEASEFGNISVYDHDPIFFRQSDFVYDEDVERNIRVEYTILPTYDTKKQRVTEKAILITIDNSDYDYVNR